MKEIRFINSHYIYFIYVILLISSNLTSQIAYHAELLSNFKMAEKASSVWGFTDQKGSEYALLGTVQGLRIISLENPQFPKEIKFIQCSPNPWREIKTIGAFAYISSESEDGLLIVDLRRAPDTFPFEFVKSFKNKDGDSFLINSAHTLYADEKNYLYLAGAKTIGGGFIILDPSQDPFHPIIIHYNNDQYMHEIHVYKDTLYGAELFNGVFSIWDLQDRTKPVRINDQFTSNRFTHSVWVEEKRKILYTADEVESAVVEAWDVSDPMNIKKTDEFKVKTGKSPFIIPHNVFHHKNRVYLSYYTEGIRILDCKDPENLIEVAYYDTQEDFESGFHGCWSVYPFFNSGICIASDIENGLFVIKYDNNAAAYLHAEITDAANSLPIFKASLKIEQNNRTVEEYSNLKGNIKTGFPEEDSVNIIVFKKGYNEFKQRIKLDKNVTTYLKIELVELPKHEIRVKMKGATNKQPLQDAKIVLYNDDFAYKLNSDSNGVAHFPNVYDNLWKIVAGKWSFRPFAIPEFSLNQNSELEIELEEGYEDDFILDLGWKTIGKDPNVRWKLGDFSEYGLPSSNFPSKDIEQDFGKQCYYTDNYDLSDIENRLHGEIQLVSPPMDLSGYENIELSYYAWAYGGFESMKEIILQFPDTSMLIEMVPENLSGFFNPESKNSIDLENISRDSVHFIFRLYNDSASADRAIRLMGALDGFKLSGKKISRISSTDRIQGFKIFPTIILDELNYSYLPKYEGKRIYIYDIYGQFIQCFKLVHSNYGKINLSHLKEGLYFIQLEAETILGRFLKLNNR